jgi:uncharacterized protein
MTKEIWLNLPVKNVARSKEFFTKLGFSINDHGGVVIGKNNFTVMLFEESVFKGIVRNGIADTAMVSEVLISIDAESREEVDEWAKKVTAAGGNVFAQPAENQGWMYGCAFTDLDGHRWNVLFMDMSKMPKK